VPLSVPHIATSKRVPSLMGDLENNPGITSGDGGELKNMNTRSRHSRQDSGRLVLYYKTSLNTLEKKCRTSYTIFLVSPGANTYVAKSIEVKNEPQDSQHLQGRPQLSSSKIRSLPRDSDLHDSWVCLFHPRPSKMFLQTGHISHKAHGQQLVPWQLIDMQRNLKCTN
jgi:hypothetical protein